MSTKKLRTLTTREQVEEELGGYESSFIGDLIAQYRSLEEFLLMAALQAAHYNGPDGALKDRVELSHQCGMVTYKLDGKVFLMIPDVCTAFQEMISNKVNSDTIKDSAIS